MKRGDIDKVVLSNIENGRTNLSTSDVQGRVAKAFGIPLANLQTEAERWAAGAQQTRETEGPREVSRGTLETTYPNLCSVIRLLPLSAHVEDKLRRIATESERDFPKATWWSIAEELQQAEGAPSKRPTGPPLAIVRRTSARRR